MAASLSKEPGATWGTWGAAGSGQWGKARNKATLSRPGDSAVTGPFSQRSASAQQCWAGQRSQAECEVVRKFIGVVMSLILVASSSGAAMASPNGVWELETRDTRIALELCGDGTQLCGTLVWLSDADYNEQYKRFLDAPVANGVKQTGPNRWKGAMQLLGNNITGTITQQSDTQMTLQGCALLVLCKTYKMFKYSE